jgi:hypothetical protein
MPLPIWIELTQAQIDILVNSQACLYGRKDTKEDLFVLDTQGEEPCSHVFLGIKRASEGTNPCE